VITYAPSAGDSLKPRFASRHTTWTCTVASRVLMLLPTLYSLYHPEHCSSPHVRNASEADVRDWVDDSTRRRRATIFRRDLHTAEAGRRRPIAVPALRKSTHQVERPMPLVCDTFIDSDEPDCSALPPKYRGTCEGTKQSPL
jgi:hypothetical protein